jgi:hypothetical protein
MDGTTTISKSELNSLCTQISRTEKVRGVSISHDGSLVIYQVQSFYEEHVGHKSSQLWLASADKANSAVQLTDGSFNDQAAIFLPDNATIVFLSDRHKYGSGLSTIFLARLIEGREITDPQRLLDFDIAAFQVSPDGHCLAFVIKDRPEKPGTFGDVKVYGNPYETRETHSRLAVYDFISRKTGILEDTRTTRHIESFCWDSSSKQLLYRLRQGREPEYTEAEVDLLKVTAASGAIPTRLGVYPRSPSGETFWFGRNACSLQSYMPSNTLDARTLTIQALEQDDESQLRLIAGIYGLGEDAVRIVDATANGRDGGYFLAVEVSFGVDTRIDIVRLHPTPEIERTIFRTSGNAIWFGAWDARRVVEANNKVHYVFAGVLSSGPRHEPPNLWTVKTSEEAGEEKMTKLSNHLRWLVEALEIHTEVIRWKADDGEELSGIVRYLKGRWDKQKPMPTVLFLHGGPYRWVIMTRLFPFWSYPVDKLAATYRVNS